VNALICRLRNTNRWQMVQNPVWRSPHSEYFAAQILEYSRFVPYVQFENSGVVYRVIRQQDLSKYGITQEQANG